MSSSLYLKDPAATRFVCGGLAEAESLLGAPPARACRLPEVEAGRHVFYVRFHPQLRTPARPLPAVAAAGDRRATSPAPAARDAAAREQPEYEAALDRMLRSVRATDRRLGLLNLFWLAHTRDVAECLREMEAQEPRGPEAQVLAAPAALVLLPAAGPGGAAQPSSRPSPAALGVPDRHRARTRAWWTRCSTTASRSPSSRIADFDFNHFLAANKRYRLSADVFFEIYSILFRETERRLREGDRGLLARVAPPPARACRRSSSRPRPAS